jgi:two-component system, OmpR family, response regulator
VTRTALIVEDEPDIASMLSHIVGLCGYAPHVVAEGTDAARIARETRPDVLLLDLMLPGRSGYDVCAELKLHRETNLLPIIIVSARDRHQDVVKGFQVGANCYVTKPFTVEQIEQALRQATEWRRCVERDGARGEVTFELKSDLKYLEELNDLLSGLFLHSGLSESQARQLATAVREMGANAIEWGHRKQIDRVVHLTYRIEPDRVTIRIKDSGPGFDPAKLPHAAHADDPAGHMAIRAGLGLRDGGFGILLSRGLVDELKYNEAGNEVTLVKVIDQGK